MEKIVFYNEWLPLPKAEFNILTMVAEQGGSYSGNYSDMCRYLSVTPQSRNIAPLRSAIESLTSKGFCSHFYNVMILKGLQVSLCNIDVLVSQ